jgi:replicative DNA helicase
MDLMSKIAKAGPQNAAILDTEKGLIEKDESQILVVDENLIKDIQWIKEGDFSEKKGERTLKLIGEVQPINKVEVVKKVRENKLKEYPLSATELADEVKKRNPSINQNRIWAILKENDLKNNLVYSDYVFRNKKQESDYENNGTVASGIPSIYKKTAIDFILNVFRNEQQV